MIWYFLCLLAFWGRGKNCFRISIYLFATGLTIWRCQHMQMVGDYILYLFPDLPFGVLHLVICLTFPFRKVIRLCRNLPVAMLHPLHSCWYLLPVCYTSEYVLAIDKIYKHNHIFACQITEGWVIFTFIYRNNRWIKQWLTLFFSNFKPTFS